MTGLVLAVAGTGASAFQATHVLGWVLLALAALVSVIALVVGRARRLAVVSLVVSLVGGVIAGVLFATVLSTQDEEVLDADTVAKAIDGGGPGAQAAAFAGGVYQDQGWNLNITGHRVVKPGEKGNEVGTKPLLVIEYTMTNDNAPKPIYPADFPLVFHVYQGGAPDSPTELEVGLDTTTTDRLGDIGDKQVPAGETVTYEQAYQLTDTTTPVDVVARLASGKELGRMSITLP